MRTQRLIIDPFDMDPEAIDRASQVLHAGGLVAFPTETVYGLGALHNDTSAVARIFAVKGRPRINPLIVHAADGLGARELVSAWSERADRLAHAFWPGPLTLILPRSNRVIDAVTAGQGTVGVRVPDHPVALALLQAAGPIAAPSANRSTRVSPTRADHVLKDLDGRIEMVLDAGPTRIGIESTVLDLAAEQPRILRPGAITRIQLEAVLGEPVTDSSLSTDAGSAYRSPGLMEVHYAPRAEVRSIDQGSLRELSNHGNLQDDEALLALGADLPTGVTRGMSVARFDSPKEAAARLYALLHHWDDQGIRVIHVIGPPHGDEWRAVADRIWRASRKWAHAGSCRDVNED